MSSIPAIILTIDPPSIPAAPYQVWKTLHEAGYETLLAGGWVRDLCLGRVGSDVDLATSATVEDVTALFPRALLLGKRFGSVVVLVQQLEGGPTLPVEVTSFRQEGDYLDGRRPTTIRPGSPYQDAQRRDFTINGLFYDPLRHRIIDYVGGLVDLRQKLLKAIGDPCERFREDRLRILRGVRFAAALKLTVEPLTWQAMERNACDVGELSRERIFQELQKLHMQGVLGPALTMMASLGLLSPILGIKLSQSEVMKKLEAFDPATPWSLLHWLLQLWRRPCEPLPLDAFAHLATLPLTRPMKRQLEHLAAGAILLHEDRERYQVHRWAKWLARAEPLDLQWLELGSHLIPQRWGSWVEDYQHQLGHLVASKDLMKLGVNPGVTLGSLLQWLDHQAAQTGVISPSLLLIHLKTHPQGALLLEQARNHKPPVPQKFYG